MKKFIYPPQQANYAVQDGQETISVQLEGGAGRYRKDILNSTSRVNVSWLFTAVGYEYFRAFYREQTAANTGAQPFLIDLLLDEALALTEHTAYLIPGSVTLAGTKGLSYVVQAQLEVIPKTYADGYFEAIIFLVEEFGDQAVEESDALFDALTKLITVDMPGTGVFT